MSSNATTFKYLKTSGRQASGHSGLSSHTAKDYVSISLQLGILETEIEDVLPTTDFQELCVSHGAMESRGLTYYMVFDIDGAVDLVRLEESCRRLVAHYDILRSVFLYVEDDMRQVVLTPDAFDVGFERLDKSVARLPLDDICAMDLRRPTDLNLGGRFVYFMLLERDPNHSVLMMRISHAQYDASSIPTFYRDLQTAYKGASIPKLPMFADFVRATPNTKEAEQAWRILLQGSSMTNLVSRGPSPYKHITNRTMNQSAFGSSRLVREHGITLSTTLKAAWALTIARMSKTRDIVFGCAVSGRNVSLEGINQILGPCLNIVPVRANMGKVSTILELLQYIQEQQTRMMPYESLGLTTLINNCTDWPPYTRFSSILNFLNDTALEDTNPSDIYFGDAKCELTVREVGCNSADLWLDCRPKTDGVNIELVYSSLSIPDTMAREMLGQVSGIIEAMCKSAESPIDSALQSSYSCVSLPIMEQQPLAEAPFLTREYQSHQAFLPKAIVGTLPANLPQLVERVWGSVEDSKGKNKCNHSEPYNERWDVFNGAARLAAKYRREGIEMPIEAIIENPTVESQVRLLWSADLGSALPNGS